MAVLARYIGADYTPLGVTQLPRSGLVQRALCYTKFYQRLGFAGNGGAFRKDDWLCGVLYRFLLLAPLWHLIRIMSSTAKKDDRPRQNVRLHPQMWEAIDDVRTKRPGVVSRNTWIAEAILEKLAREQDTGEPPSGTENGHV